MLEQLKQFFPQRVFLISGGSGIAEALLGELKAAKEGYYSITTPTFLMDHARELVGQNTERASEPLYIVCYFEALGSDAHQLLLKTLEEPGQNKFYCLVTPHPHALPQTVQSRAYVIEGGVGATKSAADFVALATEDRLVYITKHFGGETESADKKSHALRLLDELELHVCATPRKAAVIYDAKKMLLSANLSPKQVLEFVVTMLKK